MPQAIPLVLGAALNSAGVTGITLILANLAVAALSNYLIKSDEEDIAKSRTKMVRNGIAFKTIAYGEVEVSGPIVFAGGGENHLGLIVALTGHPVHQISDISLDNNSFNFAEDVDSSNRVTTSEYKSTTRVYQVNGQDPESADAVALRATLDKWGDTDKLNDISYAAYILSVNREVWSSIPSLKVIMKGKLVRDPIEMYTLQQAATDPLTAVKAYSTNWSACVLDYLMDPYLGLGIPIDEIDLLYFKLAAELSDQQIEDTSGLLTEFVTRYTCNGILSTGDSPIANVEKLLTAGFGSLTYTQGKYRLYGGEYVLPLSASEDTITEEDLAGPISIRATTPRNERFNAVRGTYVQKFRASALPAYNAVSFRQKDFPEVKSSLYKSADAGSDNYTDTALDGYIYKDITLPFTNDERTAQRLAALVLHKARQALIVELKLKPKAIRYSVGDNVKVNFPNIALGEETNTDFTSATFSPLVHSTGVITSIPVLDGGSGYNTPPKINITTGVGTGASVFPVLDQGTIKEIIVVDGGTGYAGTDNVEAESPVGAGVAWLDKVFKVEKWMPEEGGTIAVVLHEDASDTYNDLGVITGDSTPDITTTSAADAYLPRNLVLSSEEQDSNTSTDGVWNPTLNVSFDPGLKPSSVDKYEVRVGLGSSFGVQLATLSSAAALEDPVSSGEFTAITSFTLNNNVSTVGLYADSTTGKAIGAFNFNDNTNTAPLPEYADSLGNYQDFGEEDKDGADILWATLPALAYTAGGGEYANSYVNLLAEGTVSQGGAGTAAGDWLASAENGRGSFYECQYVSLVGDALADGPSTWTVLTDGIVFQLTQVTVGTKTATFNIEIRPLGNDSLKESRSVTLTSTVTNV